MISELYQTVQKMTAEWENVKALLTPEQRELIKGHAFLRGKRRQDRNVTSSDKRGGNSKR